jgi:ribosomal protein L1
MHTIPLTPSLKVRALKREKSTVFFKLFNAENVSYNVGKVIENNNNLILNLKYILKYVDYIPLKVSHAISV